MTKPESNRTALILASSSRQVYMLPNTESQSLYRTLNRTFLGVLCYAVMLWLCALPPSIASYAPIALCARQRTCFCVPGGASHWKGRQPLPARWDFLDGGSEGGQHQGQSIPW